jgi:P4 family phage/plasmid primase-like protien
LLELRSTGAQTIFPGSINPSGEIVEWDSELDILEISAGILMESVGKLAAATLIARCWKPGVRHGLALPLAGWLLNHWDQTDVEEFIIAIADAVNDDEVKDRMKTVETSQERLDSGQTATGFPTLCGIIGDDNAKKVAEWLNIPIEKTQHFDLANLPIEERCTDRGNAESFIAFANGNLRYVPEFNSWAIWKDSHWEIGKNANTSVKTLAQEYAKSIYDEISSTRTPNENNMLARHARTSNSNFGINNFISLAQSVPGVPVSPDQFDTDINSLNVLNGTIDLRSGKLRPHDRSEHHSKLAPVIYDPNVECPVWERTLSEIFEGNEEIIRYTQRALGYSLTGHTKEHAWFLFLDGTSASKGRNGKGTIINTFLKIIGTYGETLNPAALTLRNEASELTPGIAMLPGKRFVNSTETERNQRFGAALFKRLTGGDPVQAAQKYREPLTFLPQCKIFLQTNQKPEIVGADEAFWNRVRTTSFNVSFVGREDRNLAEKLEQELSGILAWAVRGAIDWYKSGLIQPVEVTEATNAYKDALDSVSRFVNDCCETWKDSEDLKQDERSCKSGELYKEYMFFCKRNRIDPESTVKFPKKLEDLGFQRKSKDGYKYFCGIRPALDFGTNELGAFLSSQAATDRKSDLTPQFDISDEPDWSLPASV